MEHPDGRVKISLFLPPYSIDDIASGFVKQYVINVSGKERARMQKLIDSFDRIICFTDGASLDNPGKSGAGIAVYGVNQKMVD